MYWFCVLIAGLLPYICTLIAKSSMPPSSNRNPREHLATVEGFRARANWAQSNSFEAFPLFAASVLSAHITGVEHECINALAMVFVGCRVLYIIVYITDRSTLRTLIWFGGLACCITLLVKAGLQSSL